MTDSLKKREIIEHAFNAFYDHGFSLGVDAVTAESGVSKRTLYKYFPSKEDLVVALLAHYRTESIRGLRSAVDALSPDARGKLRALFEVRKSLFDAGDCRGCFAVSALIEFHGRQPEIEAAANEMVAALHSYIGELCEAGGFDDPAKLADEALLLFQGAIVAAQARRSSTPFDLAIGILDRIIGVGQT
jgi:AcrR family transcriptional regulator